MSARASVTASAAARDDRSPRALWSRAWPLLALGVVAILISVAVHHWIYPAFSWNRDEPVYLWQVKALRAGSILPTDGGFPAFFQPWLSGHADGHFFSQYTLGWPVVLLVADVAFGTAAAALAFGSLLAVLGTYAFARTVTGDRTISLVAASVMLASPLFAIQSGVYLGYLFTLGLGLLFGSALITGVVRHRPLLLVGAGLMVGWIFMTRPFDAVLWAAAFGGYVLVITWKEWGRLARAAGWTVLGALPLVIATLAYNRKVTGSFTEFPITAADPLDTFGFGLRRLMPTFGKDDYTVGSAIRSVGKNGVFLPLFLFGSYLGVLVAGVGLWFRRHERSTLVLVFLMIAFPLGYFFFWGMHVSAATTTLSGPIYFIPLFGSLAVLIATAIVTVWRRRRVVGIIGVVVLVLVTVPFAVDRLDVNHRISAAQLPWRDGTETIEGRATVFIQQSGAYLLFLNPFSSNPADLDGRLLYATEQGPNDLDLIAEHPGRTPYLQQTSVPPLIGVPNDHPVTPDVTVQRLRVLSAGTVSLHVRVVNPGNDRVVRLTVDVGGRSQTQVLATDSSAGAVYETDVQLQAGADATGNDLGGAGTYGDITTTVAYGPAEADVRQVIPYRVVGDTAELLLPSRGAVAGLVNGKPGWIEARSLDQLQVDASRG